MAFLLLQFTGQPTIVYYASTIFQALGFQSSEKATLASLGIGLAKVAMKHLQNSISPPRRHTTINEFYQTRGETSCEQNVNFQTYQ